VTERSSLPEAQADSVFDLLKLNLDLGRYASAHDEALGLDLDQFDVRVYVRALDSDGLVERAEGFGQEGGRIGVVSTEVTPEGVNFAWFVVVHEYLHTRGAKDKYDARGMALRPEGLADPSLPPGTAQPGTELMARSRPTGSGSEDLPGPPEQWTVGRWTAEEIGWME
jgi:hypothetical protein